MTTGVPSRTALRVAMRRAAHQIHDSPPLIFEDPFAICILPPESAAEIRAGAGAQHPVSRVMRAFMVARSRFAEDELAGALSAGVRQYILLGAGLDTFAWRSSFGRNGLRIFEVDHPATQSWKRELARMAGLPEPDETRYVPVDFERQSVAERLAESGFDTNAPAFFIWLGVVPYLTLEAFRSALQFLSRCAAGSGLVFDYSLPPEALGETERAFLDLLSARVAAAGEPFRLFFLPEQIRDELTRAGWHVTADLEGPAIHERYFRARSDGLSLRGRAGHLLSARRLP